MTNVAGRVHELSRFTRILRKYGSLFVVAFAILVTLFLLWLEIDFRVTPENFEKLENGMSLAQTQEILGRPTQVNARHGEVTAWWQGAHWSIQISFDAGGHLCKKGCAYSEGAPAFSLIRSLRQRWGF
jgi:hypothetical protein